MLVKKLFIKFLEILYVRQSVVFQIPKCRVFEFLRKKLTFWKVLVCKIIKWISSKNIVLKAGLESWSCVGLALICPGLGLAGSAFSFGLVSLQLGLVLMVDGLGFALFAGPRPRPVLLITSFLGLQDFTG